MSMEGIRELRERSWWHGPEVVVVADDYDLVATRSQNPLAPLAELLPQGRDLGLHVVVARRAAGMSRAAHEPVLQALSELGSPGLILSGDRFEGPLVNGVAAAAGLLFSRNRAVGMRRNVRWLK